MISDNYNGQWTPVAQFRTGIEEFFSAGSVYWYCGLDQASGDTRRTSPPTA